MEEGKNHSIFDQLEGKTNVKQQDLFNLAQSVNQKDLSKEENVRQLIHQVATVANVPVSKEKEDELVRAITNNEVPMDFGSLAKMFQKTK
ncbi:stage VI sporulation protein F [Salipaludibacillus neizhouensis]|uniref:Stage VI sporulation protein F n=1 Tax=Salipaludibacillus neizhouensis TaxID=885475 RepID=A0A3A9KD91_9BACI|nr:stage VI sporulation protein F [Salipaludibacillus neizhouensis]RKL67603.1 stage VI sporulation protein F [Salipaludibacillus neizhouensis]